jgi:3-deoxy-D-manno-octulosonate 8-phosphate phosphatase (KDO 8-P phosphatase)
MKIKVLVVDIDGTMTDGLIYIGPEGEVFKVFNIKDGLGIKKAQKAGIEVVIITGRNSDIVNNRAQELGINEVHKGVHNKAQVLEKIMKEKKLFRDNVAYIGDDENDLESMAMCGLVGCPSDAALEVIKVSNFVTKLPGGKGAVREFIEFIIEGEENAL